MENKIDLIYKDLSYKVIGILYKTFNELGYGYQEKYYQKAIASLLKRDLLKFKEQLYVPITFNGDKIGSYFLDFLIDDKIILEIKKGKQFYKKDIEQVYAYLKQYDIKLGILARFTKDGVKIKRIVNIR